jgi:large subunit ribosomal protein L29
MKAAKWRELSEDEVQHKARELAEEVFNLRFQLSMGMARNPSRVRQVRRDLARAHTILRERRGAAGAGPAGTKGQ